MALSLLYATLVKGHYAYATLAPTLSTQVPSFDIDHPGYNYATLAWLCLSLSLTCHPG